MNCTQCGAPLEKGQRFCVKCGTPVPFGQPKEEDPKLDLSAYFDQPRTESAPKAEAPRPRQVDIASVPARKAQPARKAAPAKAPASGGGKGLTIALYICGFLAVAVITFVLFLLFWPSDSGEPVPTEGPLPAVVTEEPEETPQPSPEGGVDIVIITPSPAPAPTIPPTPAPTIPPTAEPASEYLLPESNTRYLTEADLKNLTHEQLCFARNEIFARHGRIFQTPQIAAYFNAKSWYNGTVSAADFKDSVFNQYERANVSFIAEYEKKYYGGSYY